VKKVFYIFKYDLVWNNYPYPQSREDRTSVDLYSRPGVSS